MLENIVNENIGVSQAKVFCVVRDDGEGNLGGKDTEVEK